MVEISLADVCLRIEKNFIHIIHNIYYKSIMTCTFYFLATIIYLTTSLFA